MDPPVRCDDEGNVILDSLARCRKIDDITMNPNTHLDKVLPEADQELSGAYRYAFTSKSVQLESFWTIVVRRWTNLFIVVCKLNLTVQLLFR